MSSKSPCTSMVTTLTPGSPWQRNLDQHLAIGCGERLVEVAPVLGEQVAPAVRSGDGGEVCRVLGVEHPIEGVGRRGAGNFQTIENGAAAIVADNHLHSW